jgi:hypothetical protein
VKKDLRSVLLFLSVSMGPFLVPLLLNLIYFLVLNAVTVVLFFMLLSSGNYHLFPLFLVVVVIISFFIRGRLLLNWNLGLNIRFVDFLSGEDTAGKGMKYPRKVRSTLKEIKTNLKEEGFGLISGRLKTVLAAVRLSGMGSIPDAEGIRALVSYDRRLLWIDGLFFTFLLLPFGLISFVFTIGMESAVQELIFVVGFFFAWFLQSAIVRPITCLILQGHSWQVGKHKS